MPDVEFKDLVIDVTAGDGRPERVARFWATALGQDLVTRDDGSHFLAAPEDARSRTVWIDEVPEPPMGKSRVHIDTRVADGDPAPLLAAGATVVREPGDDHWWVLNDPDGVPLCVFAPHPMAPDALGPFELVVDARDPEAIATWWAARTGGTVGRRDGTTFAWVEGAKGFPYMFWVFAHVPEPKTVKNRVHWDVTLADATLDDLLAAGATLVRARDPEIAWTVLADPEGNEFCVFEPR
jgi:Glyoxalase-like domain